MTALKVQLKDQSLLIGQNYIDGKWLEAESGKRFDVIGKSQDGFYQNICLFAPMDEFDLVL